MRKCASSLYSVEQFDLHLLSLAQQHVRISDSDPAPPVIMNGTPSASLGVRGTPAPSGLLL